MCLMNGGKACKSELALGQEEIKTVHWLSVDSFKGNYIFALQPY